MSFTFGFYNAEGHDRKYDATQVSQMFDGLITDGVFATYGDHLIVEATEEPNTILVRSGRAWFHHTWNYNDANMLIQCPEAEVVLDRWDAIVLDIKPAEMDRVNDIICITGTPSSNPVKPVMADEDVHHQIPLCYIYRHAGNSTITQADIENTIGTSECPFVTGIIETINTDELILQWQDQWDNWMTSTDSYMRTWITNEQTYFINWLEDQQDYITGWESDRAAEFQEWFDNLQYILDGDVAAHLQNEIDAINAHGLSGSIFEITALDDELIGKTVTVTCGSETASAVFNSEKKAQITGFTAVGAVNIRATDGVKVAATTINVPYFGKYSVEIAFWLATVNITTTDSAFFGEVIIVYKDGVTQGTTVFDNTGHATFKINEPGTYTFSSTHAGQTTTNELTITEEGTYDLDLSGNFSYEDWLLAAGLSTQGFSSLDDVLNDEPTVRILMTKHAAVDYVVSKKDDTTSINKIFNSGYAAKWINLRDYALDKFEADPDISDVMDEVGKYGYGELVEVGLVPKMTSNTAPSGVVSASSERDGYNAYKAFDGNNDTEWETTDGPTNSWIKYDFSTPITVKSVELIQNIGAADFIASFKIQGSNDNSSWTDLYTGSNPAETNRWNIENNTAYRYYRFYCVSAKGTPGIIKAAFRTLQFYTDTIEYYEPKGNVPIMTDYTHPYGEVIKSVDSNYGYAWQAFIPNDGSRWQVYPQTAPQWMGYKFVNPVKIKRVHIERPDDSAWGPSGFRSYKLQASNDGTNWIDLTDNIDHGTDYTNYNSFDDEINNDNYYLYYRIYVNSIVTPTNGQLWVTYLQFYGRELKALVPIMTSDTTPSGEAFGTNSSSFKIQNYHAFVPGGRWYSSGSATDGSQYIGYDFGKPMKIDGFGLTSYYGLGHETGFYKFKLQVSNDKVNWINTEYTIRTNIAVPSTRHYASVDLNAEYRYYRLVGIENSMSAVANNFRLSSINFYGPDYSEHDERHWIYDHGVEIESVDLTGTGSKSGDQLECSGTGSKIQTSSAISLASFSLLRMVLGNKYIAAANAEAFGVLDTQSSWPTYSAYARLDSQDKPRNLFLDISNITESKFIGFGPNNASGQISVAEWWLE